MIVIKEFKEEAHLTEGISIKMMEDSREEAKELCSIQNYAYFLIKALEYPIRELTSYSTENSAGATVVVFRFRETSNYKDTPILEPIAILGLIYKEKVQSDDESDESSQDKESSEEEEESEGDTEQGESEGDTEQKEENEDESDDQENESDDKDKEEEKE